MDDLIVILESFNRKERFFLVAQALGQERGGDPAFTLSDDFRRELEDKVKVTIPEEPEKVFVGMDYHLDWLQAGLTLSRNIQEELFSNAGEVIKGTQEDIDLLVAFRHGDQHHLILVEAKAYSGWSNDQLKSKANRLREIFGDDGKGFGGVKPHFCLMGPKSANIKTDFPGWMKPGGELLWIDLKLPNGRRQVNRCDKVGNSYERFKVTGG